MCLRRSPRHPKNKRKKDGMTQTGRNKQSCCKRCIRKIGRFFCRRIKRCIKKKIFGTANPAFEHFEVAGYNLGSLKSKLNVFKRRLSVNNKSAEVLYKNNLSPSKMTVKNIDLLDGYNANDLKYKFSLPGSKQNLLENMVEDYKKGNLSTSRLPHKSKFDIRKLDKDQMKTILKDYETVKKRMKNNADLDADDIKRKFSITGSRGKVLEKMIADYKMGKASTTGLSVKSKFDPNKLNKDQLNDMLRKYETAQKNRKRVSFLNASKYRFQSLIDEVKTKKYSFSAVGNWFD